MSPEGLLLVGEVRYDLWTDRPELGHPPHLTRLPALPGDQSVLLSQVCLGQFRRVRGLRHFLRIRQLGHFIRIRQLRHFIRIRQLGHFIRIRQLGHFIQIKLLRHFRQFWQFRGTGFDNFNHRPFDHCTLKTFCFKMNFLWFFASESKLRYIWMFDKIPWKQACFESCAQTLSDATKPIGKIQQFIITAITFEPMMQYRYFLI